MFDAIRLLKSAYGSYQADEINHWICEFQLHANAASLLLSLLLNKSATLKIRADFNLSSAESTYIYLNADTLVRSQLLRERNNSGTPFPPGGAGHGTVVRDPDIERQIPALVQRLKAELVQTSIFAEVQIAPNGAFTSITSDVLKIIFSSAALGKLGLIDYNGPQRMFNRESLYGTSVNLVAADNQALTSHSLYNYSQKYNNIKGEIAAAYVRGMIAAASADDESQSLSTAANDLNVTLAELFSNFFPDKVFKGPRPTASGLLEFPVYVGDTQHDLNDLSAGEKEILYGYLRLRAQAPKYSIILLDEPERHLNPRLIRKLPRFYNDRLGEALQNQVWLVTHSDAMLRDIKDDTRYSLYHMSSAASTNEGQSQAIPLAPKSGLENLVLDLVGDLATYRPGGKVVIFEGGGDSEFDLRMTTRLFPDLASETNCVSGNNKSRVRALHEVLENISRQGAIPISVYSVTDSDMHPEDVESERMLKWNVYHIEKCLLQPAIICKVIGAFESVSLVTADQVSEKLRDCAAEILPQLLHIQAQELINNRLRRALKVGANPESNTMASDFAASVSRSIEKMQDLANSDLSLSSISLTVGEIMSNLQAQLLAGEWIAKFPGRKILKRFVDEAAVPMRYEPFRDLILNEMVAQNIRPDGMEMIVGKIISAN